MRTQISQKAELFARTLRTNVLGVFAMFACTFTLLMLTPGTAAATTSSTINFQARLEASSGSIAPDGNYNVEFKLYDAASSGTLLWTEDRTYNSGAGSSDARLRVANGYLTVNLGSITAFPGTLNWNQQLWLTMNIGGTSSSSVSWDGEMNPRLQLTAVPYAFQAGTLSTTDGSGNIGTLKFNTTATNPAITLPDATGTVCLQGSSSCGFAIGSGTAFLQGGNSFGVQGVLGTNDGNSLALRTNNNNRLVIDTSGNLQLQQASTFNIASAATGAQLTIKGGDATSGTNVGGTLLLQGGAGASTGASGAVIVKSNTNNSTTAFQVQDASGVFLLNSDTTNKTVTLRSGNDFRTIGSELYIGNFSGGWTTTGWNVSGATTAIHNTGNTNSLINTNVSITAGATYVVSFSLGGTCSSTSQTITVNIGGTTASVLDGTNCDGSTQTVIATAGSTAGLTFMPTSSWSNTISNISIKQLTGTINPVLVAQNASGTANLEVRTSSGTSNLFIGLSSGSNNSSGSENTSLGAYTLQSNVDGYWNTAAGIFALQYNTSGYANSAFGDGALQSNTTGYNNSAFGLLALATNTSGFDNEAFGHDTLSNNTTGHGNAAFGDFGLGFNTTGSNNSALGSSALCNNTTGSLNAAVGFYAGCNDSGGTFLTLPALQNATAIGAYAQVQSSNSIVLGSVDTATKVGVGITVPSNTFSVSPLDYQNGTVTRTNGSTTLTGTGTGWASSVVGDIIIFADGTTNSVLAVNGAASITMASSYSGTTDASPVNYRLHKVGLQVTSAGNAYIQNTSTTAFQIENGADNNNLFLANTTGVNLISNSSAEANANGWSVTTSGSAPASTTAQALFGNSALAINTPAATSNAGAKYDTPSLLSASTTYAFSFWAKIASGSFTVQAGRSDTDVFGGEATCTLNNTTVTTTWTHFACVFTTGGSITTGGYVFIRQSDNTSRTWYVDGIQLEQATTATNYREGSLQFNGTVTSPTIFENAQNTASAFQIQNAAGASIFNVDTTVATNNLVTNGGFDLGNTTGWAAISGATLSADSTQAWQGNTSLKVATTTTANDGAKYTFTPAITTYTLSFFAKVASNTITDFSYGHQDSGGGQANCATGVTLTTNWQRFVCTYTTTTTASANVFMRKTGSSAETFYIDGVQVQAAAFAGGFTAGGGVQINGAISSPLVVQNSVDSSMAFQIQSASGNSVLSVGTFMAGNWMATQNLSTVENASSATANGYVYVLGGMTNATTGSSTATTSVQYAKINSDGSLGTWSTTQALPSARYYATQTAAVYNGYIYYAGGYDNTGTRQSTVYYAKLNGDGTVGTWNTTTSLGSGGPGAVAEGETVAANGYLYYIGGNNGASDLATSYYAKINADGTVGTWTSTGLTLPSNLGDFQAVVANGYIYTIGGWAGGGGSTNDIFSAKLNSNGTLSGTGANWYTPSNATSNSLPGAGLNDMSAVVANGTLYIIAGSTTGGGTPTQAVYYTQLPADGSANLNPLVTGSSIPAVRWKGTATYANGYIYYFGGDSATTTTVNTVYYMALPKVSVAADLDLIGATNGQLNGVSNAGGSIYAGSIYSNGNLSVQGNTVLQNGLSVTGAVTVKDNANSTAAFQIQNASSNNLFTADTTNNAIILGNDGAPSALTVRGGAASGSNVFGTNLTFDASNGTGASGSGDFVFRTAAGTGGITQDATSKSNNSSLVTTLTWNHTVANQNNRILIVGLVADNTTIWSSVKWDQAGTNQSLTRLGSQATCGGGSPTFSYRCHVDLWYVLNPTTGTHTITATSNVAQNSSGGAVSYYNVDQTTPFGTSNSAVGTAAGTQSASASVNTANPNQVVVGIIGANNTTTNGSGAQLWNDTFAFIGMGASKQGTGGSVSLDWNVSNGDWAVILAPLNPAANSTADSLQDRLHITAAGNVGINTASPQYTLDVAGTQRVATTSTTAFQIQTGVGATVLVADTQNNKITLGAGSGTAATLLVLGSKSDAGDPACTSGGVYYNANSSQFRGCQNGTWRNLIGGVDVQDFTASGSWTKPSGVSAVMVLACGGGGAGGGGAGAAAPGARQGGTGGGGGAYVEKILNAADLSASVSVTVGAQVTGASGGANVSGSNGNSGNPSSFGSYVAASGGGGGAGGPSTAANRSGGAGGGAAQLGGAGGAANSAGGDSLSAVTTGGLGWSGGAGIAGGNGTPGEMGGGAGGGTQSTLTVGSQGGSSVFGGGGGGGGGSVTAASPGTANSGNSGGGTGIYSVGGGGLSGSPGTAGAAGSSAHCGAGGGGGNSNNAATGGAGGAGGVPGGAGGGGGGGTSTGGAGGNGARGEVWVISW